MMKESHPNVINIYTVKLGYNELGCNELPLIANKKISLVGLGELTK
jgi:hypothetical protein